MLAHATIYGHFDCIKFMCESEKLRWEPRALEIAAEKGYFDVIQYAYDHGAEFHARMTSCAAKAKNLGMVKFLREKGVKWDQYTCSKAAGHGALDVLQYAHTNGCMLTDIQNM